MPADDQPEHAPALMALTTEYARLHPEDWRRLDTRFADLSTSINQRFTADETRIGTLETKVDGNHSPGIVTRLARVETYVKIIVGIASIALTAAAGAIVTNAPRVPTP